MNHQKKFNELNRKVEVLTSKLGAVDYDAVYEIARLVRNIDNDIKDINKRLKKLAVAEQKIHALTMEGIQLIHGMIVLRHAILLADRKEP